MKGVFFVQPSYIFLAILIAWGLFSRNVLSETMDLQAQRELYDQAHLWLDRKEVRRFKKVRSRLADYPLTPYLDYRSFLIDLGEKPPIVVRHFIDSYKDFPFAYRISAPYIDALARQDKWPEMLQFSPNEPKGERYRCHYYTAKLKTGRYAQAFSGAETLWKSGASVSAACDELFIVWEQQGGLTDSMIVERMLMAFDGRNRSLMSHLAGKLTGKSKEAYAQALLKLYDHPEKVIEFIQHNQNGFKLTQSVELALEKLARRDVIQALEYWHAVNKILNWPDSQQARVAQYIALRMMEVESDEFRQWRDSVIEQSSHVHLIETRIRLALREQDWLGITHWITRLPESEQGTLRWQYWLARSELAQGKESQGIARMHALLGQRNFYSVAAAQWVKQSIQYPSSSLALEHSWLKPYQKSLMRIDELIQRDKIAAAKSEWNLLLQHAQQKEKEMLAVYAATHGWHHLTVKASISASLWDNTQLRFPLAHQWWFNFYGKKHGISPVTLMSLARQESAMDVEARSPVGARGIMQIMPSTARYTAKKYQLNYEDADELYQVGKNIEIGSHYLNGLLERYDNNRILSFAAYNAGPSRVDRWQAQTQGKLDAYAFIEAIPFRETRGYVQNILMFETYYRNLMALDGEFLTQQELATSY
ncbi:transglycosylase SLT domain-containing protein [Vibrio sp. V27_P1S3P104]|uniref:transglycosylase SLT domain-containing protein n=1 Tax=unclassified Vibrio TaxID=2614977 RepID=UPI0013733237|nr:MULTISPECIES: transglycosylase SLT domain-containing protein [unclassified Vibrio]NAW70236.1 transglycosylase SLT domain-containing protein [Vibrio sp. V28_P6S34P95]NAX04163.1 transglycosylase SLT domain-containing protein [Vibrio sp. V30_P3S12P165]NAX35435.1 transglycosylase SLT domain-containing protein [Vibrio sp. V29_P1S30P107]NAX38606.1 transglycosylase SLT domain-containing protein [Vibrio sp. V27_P1S3P104]NAX40470.1 transglycosylase SLT domain-containing protein [Vibrio sp. V26_P1S5P